MALIAVLRFLDALLQGIDQGLCPLRIALFDARMKHDPRFRYEHLQAEQVHAVQRQKVQDAFRLLAVIDQVRQAEPENSRRGPHA